MRVRIIITLFFITLQAVVSAQNSSEKIIAEVIQNNSTLAAYRKATDAEKIGNKTGIYLQNPEVSFNYLWGSPSAIGNRTDFSILQIFDFPTAYSHRNQISTIQNEQAELEFQKNLRDIIYRTRTICVELTFYQVLIVELNERLEHAQVIASSFQKKFDAGDVGILENNKAKFNLLNHQKELERVKAEQLIWASKLKALNGGKEINFDQLAFEKSDLPADFEKWFALAEIDNQVLNWLKKEVEKTEATVKLTSAMGLPKFQAGYMSEKVVGEQFKGVSVGMVIPLWENKNSIKSAKAQALASEELKTDQHLQFYQNLKALHAKALAQQLSIDDYQSKLTELYQLELLTKALDKGEITLIEFMMELSIFYESKNNLLELKRDFQFTLAELKQF